MPYSFMNYVVILLCPHCEMKKKCFPPLGFELGVARFENV